MRHAWEAHAQRRLGNWEVKAGEFLDSEDLGRILQGMETSAGAPSAVFFFTASANQEFRSRLESSVWPNSLVVLAKTFFRFPTRDEKLPKKHAVSFLALPRPVPVKALSKSEFFDLKNDSSNLEKSFLIFTDNVS